MNLFAQSRQFFPDPCKTLVDGLVAISDDLDWELLFEAYSFGIFPWPQDEDVPVLWFSPGKRGILEFSELHISKSLRKLAKKTSWVLTMDKNFNGVIEQCSKIPRPDQDGTWITPDMVQGYIEFHKKGYAHSIECWDGDRLIGGMYGVYVGGVFSGESMFFYESNASKLCFWTMVKFLEAHGITWMDAQMVTPNVEAFGAKYIKKSDYLKKLAQSKEKARFIEFKNQTFLPREFLF